MHLPNKPTEGEHQPSQAPRKLLPGRPGCASEGPEQSQGSGALGPLPAWFWARAAPGSGSPGLPCRPLLAQMVVPRGLSPVRGAGQLAQLRSACPLVCKGELHREVPAVVAQSPPSEPSSHAIAVSISKSPGMFPSFCLLSLSPFETIKRIVLALVSGLPHKTLGAWSSLHVR